MAALEGSSPNRPRVEAGAAEAAHADFKAAQLKLEAAEGKLEAAQGKLEAAQLKLEAELKKDAPNVELVECLRQAVADARQAVADAMQVRGKLLAHWLKQSDQLTQAPFFLFSVLISCVYEHARAWLLALQCLIALLPLPLLLLLPADAAAATCSMLLLVVQTCLNCSIRVCRSLCANCCCHVLHSLRLHVLLCLAVVDIASSYCLHCSQLRI